MNMRKIFSLIIVSLSVVVYAQKASNAQFTQVGKTVEITYTLDKQADIVVYLSTDGGRTFGASPLKAVTGDVGNGVTAGQKKIIWSPFDEYEKLVCDNAVFKIVPSGGEKLSFTVGGVPFTMIKVEGGTFTMGCTSEQSDCDSDEERTHQVTLSDYYIGQTEVTQALWQAVMGTTIRQQRDKADKSWSMRGEGANYPMYYISYTECQEFIIKLNNLTGRKFALPTEAQWEFAARGGRKSGHYKFAGSNTIGNVAWYDGNSNSLTHPVALKTPNELGLYDMSGNVWEWCYDWYGEYSSSSQTNPHVASSGQYRVNRGGSWDNDARHCRVSYRYNSSPSNRNYNIGFRLVLLP